MEKLLGHYEKILVLFREMYTDVKYKLTETPMDISFFRSKPYLDAIDKEMGSLLAWGTPPAASKEGKAPGGFGGGKKATSNSKGKKGGFGK